MPSKIFIYDKNKGKVVEAKHPPVNFNNTKDHVNMRTTWSGQTKIEFTQTTVDKDVASWSKK